MDFGAGKGHDDITGQAQHMDERAGWGSALAVATKQYLIEGGD